MIRLGSMKRAPVPSIRTWNPRPSRNTWMTIEPLLDGLSPVTRPTTSHVKSE